MTVIPRKIRRRFVAQLLLSLAIALAAWWAYAAYLESHVPELAIFAPSPASVLHEAMAMMSDGDFWSATLTSNRRVLTGFSISVILAVPIGLLLGAYPENRGLAVLGTDFVRYIPVAAVLPLGILWFGIGESIKLFVLVLGTVFQLIVMVTDDVRRVPAEMLESALTLGASRRKAVWTVLLPAAGPALFDSLRVAMSFCWTYLMMAELVAPMQGLGHLINYSQRFLQIGPILVVVLFLGLLGLLYDTVFVAIRGRLFPWVSSVVSR